MAVHLSSALETAPTGRVRYRSGKLIAYEMAFSGRLDLANSRAEHPPFLTPWDDDVADSTYPTYLEGRNDAWMGYSYCYTPIAVQTDMARNPPFQASLWRGPLQLCTYPFHAPPAAIR